MSVDQALALAGGLLSVVAVVWLFGRLFMLVGWDNVRRLLRDPPILLALLGMLLGVASVFL